MNYRSLIITAVFFSTLVVVPVFIIWPSVQNIRATAALIYGEYELLEDKHRRGHEMKKVAEEYREILPSVEKLRSNALETERELDYITELERLATDNNVNTTLRLNIDNIKAENKYQNLPYDLTISGSYQDTLKYLSQIESLPFFTQINAIKMSRNSKSDSSTASIQTQISATVLQQKPINN